MLLARFLSRIIRVGRLELVDASGQHHVFAGAPGPIVAVRLHDKALHGKFIINPRLSVPEAYMDGTLTIEQGDIYAFLDLLARNDELMVDTLVWRLAARLARLTRRLHQYNPVARSRRNVAHHYDLSDELYDLFLDRDRQYSCAYFLGADDDIDTAQLNKRRHIAAKLLLRPGRKVLAVAGAGSRSISRASAALTSPASRFRPSSSRSRSAAPRRPALPTACALCCATTARSAGNTTALFRSACSSMSASGSTRSSSPR